VYPSLPEVPLEAYLVHSCAQEACTPSDAVSFQGAQQRCFDAGCELLQTVVLNNESAPYFWCAAHGVHLSEDTVAMQHAGLCACEGAGIITNASWCRVTVNVNSSSQLRSAAAQPISSTGS
jgi:hypothetical protein